MSNTLFGQGDWKFIEETHIKSTVSGTITEGYIFKTSLHDFYVVKEHSRQRIRIRKPKVKIFRRGNDFKLEIENFYRPVICEKIRDVVETQIDGTFKGWDGETIFKMMNGQIWQQSSYAYLYHYAFQPEVLIYQYNDVWIMKVEDENEEVEETIQVKNLKE